MISARSFRSILKCANQSKNLITKRHQTPYVEGYEKPSMIRLGQDDSSLQITSFNQFGFSINNNIKTIGPIIIFPKTIYGWNIDDVSAINENSLLLFKLIEPKLDVIIIGYGDKEEKINPNVSKWFIQNKINNFEILPTVSSKF